MISSTLARRSPTETGLASWPTMLRPESPARSGPSSRWAETITTGIVCHRGVERTFSRKSHPEARGIRRSSRIKSGKRSRMRSPADRPSSDPIAR
jgi:hypothetical protein